MISPMINLLVLVILGALLQISSAAPAAACVVSSSTSTIILPVQVDHEHSHAATASPSASIAPTLPTNGDGTELPAPTGTLKFVTVGRGVQNYSCNAAGAAPVAVGAVANLFDYTSLAYTNIDALHIVTATAVYEPREAAGGAKISFPGLWDFPRIGHHFFDATGTPVFSLDAVGDALFCKKIASVNAPAHAPVGPDGTGAVPWLMLDDKGGSQGLSEVYRVVTAGGKAPASCPDTRSISIQYAAEYWFYA